MDMKTALQIAKEINVNGLREDARAILEAFENASASDDFTVDFGRIEYRIISDDEIEAIHRRELEELVDDCYGIASLKKKLGNIGNYFDFDYDAFARDCSMSDGYGHHFASYDGEEIEIGNYRIFRVN
jgi:hypothetical protein